MRYGVDRRRGAAGAAGSIVVPRPPCNIDPDSGEEMIITTAATIAGRRIVNTIGLVRGNTVRARHAGRDIMAGLKTLVGGEIVSYTEMMEEARREAVERLIADAEGQGANAVTDVRFSTASIMGGAAEILAYGTAVVTEPAH